jgi:serine/arginine repetitive matrix protein 2
VRQAMSPSSTPYGTTPLISSAPQDGPELKTHRADVTPRFPVTPVSLKHAPRAKSPPPASPSKLTLAASSSWMPLSRANSETKRRLMPETPAGNDLCTTIYPLSHAKSLHVRTPAPPGAWMSTTSLNLSNTQSNFGSIRGSIGKKKHSLKVRFDVTESEASTAEVEQNVPLVTDMRMPTPNSLLDGRVSRSENVPRTRTNDFCQANAVNSLVDRPVTPGSHMTPVSRAGAPSSRPLRKAFSVKFVDAFGRERSDEIPIPIANGHAGAGDATRALPSAKALTPRISSKNKIRVINATGKEVQEDVPERSSVLYDDPSSRHTATLAQIRRTLRTWAGGLSDEDR